MKITRLLTGVFVCLAMLTSGCAITLGPAPVVLKSATRPPVVRLDRISEQVSGAWPGGGMRNYITNALKGPEAASFFSRDGTGLAMQIDIISAHRDDNPRLVGLGLLSLATLGVVPLHYHSEWPVSCEVTLLAEDGTAHRRYTFEATGIYDIWAFPLTMFTLLGAGLQGNADGRAVLQRTADDLVAQIVGMLEADAEKLAALRSSPSPPTARVAVSASGTVPPLAQADVDDLPVAKTLRQSNAYAIVIGIEQYRQNLPRATYAAHDAKVMVDYLTRVLGYPEENVIALIDDRALKSDLEKYLEKWLPNHVEPGSRLFVYYSGHGAPSPQTGDAYLVPHDGDPAFIEETGYSLQRLYASLGRLPTREAVVVLDSCFSGAGDRSVLAKGARPLVIRTGTPAVVAANLKVLSASAGDQISSTYEEKGHGLFTYFLLKGIKNEEVTTPDGALRIDDLFAYIKPQVERIARRLYNNEQTPQLVGGRP